MTAKKYKIKITVYKKFDCKELPDYAGGCHKVEVGQEFMVKEDGLMPAGFCYWAWNDVWPVIMTLRFGGSFPYCPSQAGLMYSSCTDGMSPVVFKIERMS